MANILFVRSTPYDEDLSAYNVQGVGIAKAFCKMGHNCDYLNFSKTKDEIVELFEKDGCKARAIYKKRIRILRTGINFEVLKPEFLSGYDIVICREYNQLMTYLFSKKHNNVSMYSGPYHNMFVVPFFSNIYDYLFTSKMNTQLRQKFVKSEIAKDFLEKKGYTELIDVGVGLDTSRFCQVECKKETEELASFMKENPCILFVGSLCPWKNIELILDSFARVLEKKPDVKLVLIGKSEQSLVKRLLGKSNESYYDELIKKMPKNVRESIKHVQRVENPQLQYIYPLAKVFVLPSLREIFGMVLLEAMYFGTPVVSSYNGGSSTLIKSADYGQLVREYDAEKWANAICRYLDDKEYSNKVIENGKALVRGQYTWDSVCKKILYYIQEK